MGAKNVFELSDLFSKISQRRNPKEPSHRGFVSPGKKKQPKKRVFTREKIFFLYFSTTKNLRASLVDGKKASPTKGWQKPDELLD